MRKSGKKDLLTDTSLLGRRAFLRNTTLFLAGTGRSLYSEPGPELARVGLFTDVHHADKPESGTRYYRESLSKLDVGLTELRKRNVGFLVCLGDLVDAASTRELERTWLRQAVGNIRETGLSAWFVLGNHCVQTLTKAEFLAEARQEQSYCSFDHGGVHFVVLDACYRRDGIPYDAGNFDWKDTDIPQAQQDWLARDLAKSEKPVIVFVHQRLDEAGVHSIAGAARLRRILEQATNVRAVFQGHSHQNDYQEINGIHYCTMRAVVEGTGADKNGYAAITVLHDGSVRVEGFLAQRQYEFGAAKRQPA